MVVKDFLGREILRGMKIVYPTRRGAHMSMNIAIVRVVRDSGELVVCKEGHGNYHVIQRTDRVVVVGM